MPLGVDRGLIAHNLGAVQAHRHTSGSSLALCIVVLLLLTVDLCLVVASYRQFGWRVYSKIACDLRAKDGKSKQHTFLLIHGFLTLLKLDALVRYSALLSSVHFQ